MTCGKKTTSLAIVATLCLAGLAMPTDLHAYAWTHVPGAFCRPDADERDIWRTNWLLVGSTTTTLYCGVLGTPPSSQRVDGSTITEGHFRVYDASSSYNFGVSLCMSDNGATLSYDCGSADYSTSTGYDTLVLDMPSGTWNSSSNIFFKVSAPPDSYVMAYSAVDDS